MKALALVLLMAATTSAYADDIGRYASHRFMEERMMFSPVPSEQWEGLAIADDTATRQAFAGIGTADRTDAMNDDPRPMAMRGPIDAADIPVMALEFE
ncbi:hypothetical protein A33M_3269 [Rhodovulum sp. PH10]|uniref:hypothetical protein n=1 Tax=Rhodovulum sp. PH10 TaxID=1187851 RepID=UPI00027C2696|nr:hypothetical protein [Rhodovulum sp. PH10]EJW11303.1 hypothetical protein A33M_3269 [Rhodovulum sp. PH10]